MNPFRSKLGAFNFLVAQWFFVRLQEEGAVIDGVWEHHHWTLLRWVVPVTGWWNNYIFLGDSKERRLF